MKKLYASPPSNATARPCVAHATNPFSGGMAPIPPAGRRATGPGPKSSGLRLISRSATRAVCRNIILVYTLTHTFLFFFVTCEEEERCVCVCEREKIVNQHAINNNIQLELKTSYIIEKV